MYCNPNCSVKYRKAKHMKKAGINHYYKNKNKCKYCKDNDHTRYCCPEHREIYKAIRRDIKIERAKSKPAPTESEDRMYAKIRDFLNKPL